MEDLYIVKIALRFLSMNQILVMLSHLEWEEQFLFKTILIIVLKAIIIFILKIFQIISSHIIDFIKIKDYM